MIPAGIQDIADALAQSQRRLEAKAVRGGSALRLAKLLARVGRRLVRPPRIVLLGEFNAGKTTLANALIGSDVLPTSFHANTRIPIRVFYSAVSSLELELADRSRRPLTDALLPEMGQGRARMLHVGLPVDRLRGFELIDTPGLASGMANLEQANADAFRHANAAIWCTSATQAWKATERAAWHDVPARLRRRGLLVVTLIDMLNTERERGRVQSRLQSEAAPHFAKLVMVNAADVDELRRNRDLPDHEERWVACGGSNLDAAIARLVDDVWDERRASVGRVLARIAAGMARDDDGADGATAD